MDSEQNRANRSERTESGQEEIIAQVIPNSESIDRNSLYPEQSSPPIEPFELPKQHPEVHNNIPNHPLRRVLQTEKERIDEANKLLSGRVLIDKGGPDEAIKFLQQNIDLPPNFEESKSNDNDLPELDQAA